MHKGNEVVGENWETENKFTGVVNEFIYAIKFFVAPIYVVHVTTVDCWKFIWNEDV